MDHTDRLEFAPPPTAGLVRGLILAVLAHTVLVAALTWGVRWKREAQVVTVQAELWSTLPQAAAPKLVDAAPPPPATPAEQAPPKAAEADIALEREKQRLRMAREQEVANQEQQRRDKARREQERRREQDEKAAADQKQAELAKRQAAQKAQQEVAKLEAQRQLNMQRMAGLAGATGSTSATGSAAQASGPSASYAARVRASIKPNVVFTEQPASNPTVEIEVRIAPDGTISSRRVIKGSGNNAWDEAVLNAIDKTAAMPRDIDGRIHSPLVIVYRYRD